MVKNFLTFDIEEWFDRNFQTELHKGKSRESTLPNDIEKIIDICAKYNIRSTCFIVAKIAEQKPEIVKKLHLAGHEIASHSYEHKLVYNMTPDEFNKDLKKSCDILQNITGEKVFGYRAPSWSVNENIANWFYDILSENGLKYSSSVYPAKTYLYGYPEFPEKIHFPLINGDKKKILEIPQSLINILNKKIGFSGGFFFRLFPFSFIKKQIEKKNKKLQSVFIYLHPYELSFRLKGFELKLLDKFILNYGVKNCEIKLNKILSIYKHTFTTMKEYVSNYV